MSDHEEIEIYPCKSPDHAIIVSDKTRNDEIVEMLLENFICDETMLKSLKESEGKLSPSEEADYQADSRLMMMSVVDVATVILAIHKETNRISGAIFLMIREIADDGNEKGIYNPYSQGLLRSKITKDFYNYADKIVSSMNVNLNKIYPNCGKLYAEVEIVAVNRLDRNNGLALDLYKAAVELLKTMQDVSIISGVYTSVYSKKVAEKIGKKVIARFDIKTLKDENGRPVFQDTEPHNIMTMMAMRI
ncbi:uncharacterized protein LOC105688366 [Athalia rosae]|uniref:uncharacterized protein LOC105688366 n=1 Tax=Athalia rosae TaxID=37344 RepID=UPI00203320C7|nr:uncharacterized protein LOC105688366 [Athalia rosae]XP_012260022.2 uncharacterized protein LOC105688366 [Athalia rosae]